MDASSSVFVDTEAFEFWLLMAGLLGLAIYLLRTGLHTFWRLRTILDTPTSKIKSAPQGYVELSGLAQEANGTVPGKLTGKPCVWYQYRIQRRKSTGRSNNWTTIEQGTAERPFALDDGTGRCLVEPEGALVKLRQKEQWHGPHRDPSRGDIRFAWLGRDARYRFTEFRIQAGDPIYLLGRFETPRRGPAERERLQHELLRLWKRDPKRMARFDTDGDGQISPAEWDRARQEAERLAAQSEQRLNRAAVIARVVDTGDSRHPFVISTHSVEDLTSRLRWQTIGLNVGFLGVVALLGAAVIERLG